MKRNPYDELAHRIRRLVDERVRSVSPPVDRATVQQANPLVVSLLSEEDDLLLEEGDPDVEIDRAVLADRPAVGDLVRVHKDGSDYIVSGVIE